MPDELALSERHDADGRHDEAINALARAAQAGDVESMTRLGKRLVIGDRGPLLPREGAGLLVDAAHRGGAEAADRVAVLAAVGVEQPQSWRQAVESLAVAAARGWRPAQAQLRLLAADRAGGSEPASSDAIDWTRLAADIDLAFWTAAATGEMRNETPLVRSFPSFVPAAVGAWLIARSHGRLERARVYDAVRGQDTAHEIRTNSAASFNLMDTDLVFLLVQARMAATTGWPLRHFEAPAVLCYAVGEQIGPHYDFVDPQTPNYAEELERRGQRVLTFLVYLNDDYEGGETGFPKLELIHRGVCGEGLLFGNALPDGRPDLRAVHTGNPPTSGTKWVLSQFIRDRDVLSPLLSAGR